MYPRRVEGIDLNALVFLIIRLANKVSETSVSEAISDMIFAIDPFALLASFVSFGRDTVIPL